MTAESEVKSKKNIGFYLAVIMILLISWVTFDQTINGLKIGNDEIGSNTLLSALCWWYVWKKLGRNQFVGVGIGVLNRPGF